MSIDVLKLETDNVKHFLQEYRDGGLSSAQTDAKEMAEKMQIDMTFPVARQRKTTRYEGKEETQFTPEEQLKQDCFLPLLDTALTSVS